MPAPATEIRTLAHPRFFYVDADIFRKHLEPDCMNHSCVQLDPHIAKHDICCQYGADVDLDERAAILSHGEQLRSIMDPDAAAAPWFTEEELIDPDYPSGKYVRTAVHNGGCVFLSHDKRGCAIHRASIEGGWDFHGVKPGICRLFPLTYTTDSILISDDYREYSCAYQPGTPTLYRALRSSIAALFGEELVIAMDAVEMDLRSTTPGAAQPSLRVIH